MDQRRIKVAIVGCGLIGARWDAAEPSPSHSLTHAAAFSRHARATLAAVCDPNPVAAEEAAQRWGAGQAYTDPHAMFADVALDLVVIATPSTTRWQVIGPALAAGVKAMVIEKPLAASLAESHRLALAVDAAGAKSLVNFSRHWDPGMRDLRQAIRAGELGEIQRLVGTYGKGLINNGSHMIDLAGFLCDGRPLRGRALDGPRDPEEADWSNGSDATWDAQVIYKRDDGSTCHLTMLGTDQNAFTCFELRVIGRRAIYEISRGGRSLTVTPIEPDPNYKGYRIPGTTRILKSRALEAMDRMADEALQLATGDLEQASCDARCALNTALTIDALQRSSRAQGAWIDILDLQQ